MDSKLGIFYHVFERSYYLFVESLSSFNLCFCSYNYNKCWMVILSITYYKNKNNEDIYSFITTYFPYNANLSKNHFKQVIKNQGKLNFWIFLRDKKHKQIKILKYNPLKL